jgi:hypothetical protein
MSRARLAAFLTIAFALPGMPIRDAAATTKSSIPRVETDLGISRVDEFGSAALRVDARWRLYIPHTAAGLGPALRHARGSAERALAIERLIRDAGIKAPLSPTAPSIAIKDGIAVIAWTEETEPFSLDGIPRWHPGESHGAGSFPLLLRSGWDLRVHLDGPLAARKLPWDVRLTMRQGHVVALAPLPGAYSTGDAFWELLVRDRPATIRVQFTVDREIRRSLLIEGQWWRVGRALSYFVGGALVFVLLILWAIPWRRPGRAYGARRIAIAGVLIGLSSLVCSVVTLGGVRSTAATAMLI